MTCGDEAPCEVSGYFPVLTHTIAKGVAAVAAGLESTGQGERIGEIEVSEPIRTRCYGWVRYVGWFPAPGVTADVVRTGGKP